MTGSEGEQSGELGRIIRFTDIRAREYRRTEHLWMCDLEHVNLRCANSIELGSAKTIERFPKHIWDLNFLYRLAIVAEGVERTGIRLLELFPQICL